MAFGIPNLERLVSNFLEDGSGITAIRSVEWAKKYLWIVDFVDPKPPAPFDKFFPANDITAPLSIVESQLIDLPHSSLSFPKRGVQQDLRITFYDDEQQTLLRWLSDWQKIDLLNQGLFVSGLGDSHQVVCEDSFGDGQRRVSPLRQVRFALLDAFRDEVMVKTYWVYPDGEIVFNGGQASEATTYSVNFKVVKDGLVAKADPVSFFSVKNLKQILGRFL